MCHVELRSNVISRDAKVVRLEMTANSAGSTLGQTNGLTSFWVMLSISLGHSGQSARSSLYVRNIDRAMPSSNCYGVQSKLNSFVSSIQSKMTFCFTNNPLKETTCPCNQRHPVVRGALATQERQMNSRRKNLYMYTLDGAERRLWDSHGSSRMIHVGCCHV